MGSGDRIMSVIFQLTNYIVAEYLKFLHHPRASCVGVPLNLKTLMMEMQLEVL